MSFSAFIVAAMAFGQSLPAPDIADTTYARIDTVDLKLDIYYPKLKTPAPLPVLVWIHGGGWRSGSKADCRPALELLDSGYAVVSIDYRLSHQAIWPAQIHDCKAAIRWLRAHGTALGLDTARIAAWGSSAGGHLAAMLGTTGGVDSMEGKVGNDLGRSSRVKAVVDYYGPADLPTMGGAHNGPGAAEALLLGCAIPDCLDKAGAASPLHHVSADDAPFSIFHGTADGNVAYRQSVALDSALRKAGVPTALWALDGAGHGGLEFTADSTLARAAAFLKQALPGSGWPSRGTFTVTGNPEDAMNGAAWSYQEDAPEAVYDLAGRVWKPAGSGPFPVVLINHGTGGSANTYSKQVAQVMVKWGYACFAPNYTHSGGVPCGSPGACVEAEFAASPANILRGLKSLSLIGRLAYADTATVMTFGHSRGSYLTTALLANTTRFRAAAHTAGGVIPDNAPGTAPRYADARKIRTPYLLHHGDLDQAVLLAFDQRLDSILGVTGTPHRLHVYLGYDHNAIPFDTLMFRRTREWFEGYRSPSRVPGGEAAHRRILFEIRSGPDGLEILHDLPVGQVGSLHISDLAGRKAAEFKLRWGAGSLVWSGADAMGGRSAAGVYLVTLKRPGVSAVTRLAPFR